MRGERILTKSQQLPLPGSSPRARGTQLGQVSGEFCLRLIPACAGNARPSLNPSRPRAAHPRVRGERVVPGMELAEFIGSSPRARGTLTDQRQPSALSGSSPRARGTPQGDDPVREIRRLIPACAGNALHPRQPSAVRTAHPRVRGERLPAGVASQQVSRLIPACAGNALSISHPTSCFSAHPRVRGERNIGGYLESRSVGSSPRARGTRLPSMASIQKSRLIPACAGNAYRQPDKSSRSSGSSPRARGTPQASIRARRFSRLIPACAGNAMGDLCFALRSLRLIPACAGNAHGEPGEAVVFPAHPRVRGERALMQYMDGSPPAHPRVRGERGALSLETSGCGGSSPRARGTLPMIVDDVVRARLIPACAGNALMQRIDFPEYAGSSPRARGTLS